MFEFHLPQALADDVSRCSAALAMTPFMYLLAAWTTVLAERWQSDDVWTATLTANRALPELESMVGLLVNTVPLRTRVRMTDTFGELAARVRSTVLDAYDHQEVPFEELMEHIRATGVDPAVRIPVMFVLQDAPRPSLALDEVNIAPFDLAGAGGSGGATLTTFAMTVTLTPSGNGIAGSILWRTAVVEREVVADLAAAYVRVLGNACRNPARPLTDLRQRDDRGPADLAGVPPARPLSEATPVLSAVRRWQRRAVSWLAADARRRRGVSNSAARTRPTDQRATDDGSLNDGQDRRGRHSPGVRRTVCDLRS